jgi:hypothetical protein
MFNETTKLIRMQVAKVKQLLKREMHSNTLPENALHDDVYLVAFPKSGITWLSFLMANVHLKCSGIDGRATFFNAHTLIPDIHINRKLKTKILGFPGFRVIKSHSEYNPYYNRLFYIVRDPKDVMVSYYNFLTKDLGNFNGSISDMVRSNAFGIETWCRHVDGWCTKTSPSQMINYIRYEDLKMDAKSVLDRIYTVIGLKIPDGILDFAVEKASFNSMKRDEDFYSTGNVMLDSDVRFMRKGESGGYKSELTDDDIRHINEKAQKWLKLFKYTD